MAIVLFLTVMLTRQWQAGRRAGDAVFVSVHVVSIGAQPMDCKSEWGIARALIGRRSWHVLVGQPRHLFFLVMHIIRYIFISSREIFHVYRFASTDLRPCLPSVLRLKWNVTLEGSLYCARGRSRSCLIALRARGAWYTYSGRRRTP